MFRDDINESQHPKLRGKMNMSSGSLTLPQHRLSIEEAKLLLFGLLGKTTFSGKTFHWVYHITWRLLLARLTEVLILSCHPYLLEHWRSPFQHHGWRIVFSTFWCCLSWAPCGVPWRLGSTASAASQCCPHRTLVRRSRACQRTRLAFGVSYHRSIRGELH